MQMILAIAAGGALGAVLRHFFGAATMSLTGISFPVGTMGVNIIGSFIMGALISYFALVWSPSPEIKAFLTVGILGGFTTFSAFSLDTVALLERGQISLALLYVCASIILSIAALFVGMILIKQVYA